MTNEKGTTQRERLKTDSVQALQTTINVTISKWETHFDWQTPQDKKTKKTQQDSIIQARRKLNKTSQEDTKQEDRPSPKEEAEIDEERTS